MHFVVGRANCATEALTGLFKQTIRCLVLVAVLAGVCLHSAAWSAATAQGPMPKTPAKPPQETQAPKRPMGRPPGDTYTQAVADEICERLTGGEPLANICRDKSVVGMPALRTVTDWREAHPDFAAAFARARDSGEYAIAADCLTIADTPQEGVRTEIGGKDGGKEIHEDMLGHRKLRIDTRLKLLAKWNPKKWGDRSAHEVSGPNGAPIGVKTETRNELIDAVLALVVSKPDAGGAK